MFYLNDRVWVSDQEHEFAGNHGTVLERYKDDIYEVFVDIFNTTTMCERLQLTRASAPVAADPMDCEEDWEAGCSSTRDAAGGSSSSSSFDSRPSKRPRRPAAVAAAAAFAAAAAAERDDEHLFEPLEVRVQHAIKRLSPDELNEWLDSLHARTDVAPSEMEAVLDNGLFATGLVVPTDTILDDVLAMLVCSTLETIVDNAHEAAEKPLRTDWHMPVTAEWLGLHEVEAKYAGILLAPRDRKKYKGTFANDCPATANAEFIQVLLRCGRSKRDWRVLVLLVQKHELAPGEEIKVSYGGANINRRWRHRDNTPQVGGSGGLGSERPGV